MRSRPWALTLPVTPRAALLLVLATSVSAQPRTELGQRFPTERTLDSTHTSRVLTGGAAKYMRARLRLADGSQEQWYLTVRDAHYRLMEVLTPASFGADRTRWTMRVKGSRILLDLELADSSSDPRTRVKILEYLVMPEKAQNPYYSVQSAGSPQYRDLYEEQDSALRIRGEAVGMVMPSYDRASWCCSGVVVGEGLLLTNWHCGAPKDVPDDVVWSDVVCRNTIVDLSWDGDEVSRELQCVGVPASNKDLDFALLEFKPLSAQGPARPALVRGSPPQANEGIDVIHHPECRSKQITRNCTVEVPGWPSWVSRRPDVDVAHRCDTEAGSSGGAVYDRSGALLALHHRGFAHTSDERAKREKLNMAVRLDRILAFLGSCDAATPRCQPNLLPRINLAP